MTVTFCGHSKIEYYTTVSNLLYIHIENLIKNGADIFLIGSYGEFDFLAAKTVKSLKDKYPHIKSINIIPYKNKKTNYFLFDCVEYPMLDNIHPKYAIIKSNEYMVDKADVVISYIRRDTGGAFKTFAYAKKKRKDVILV